MYKAPPVNVVYGLNPAFETVLAGRRQVKKAYLGKQALRNPRVKTLRGLLEERGVPVEIHEKGRLIHLADSRDNQGVVLETGPYPYMDFETACSMSSRMVLLDNIEDPQNVGAILRSAEVLGFSTALLPLRGVPGVYPSVVKASAGATEHLGIVREMNSNQYVKRLLDEGWKILALDAAGKTTLGEYQPDPDANMLLVIGGENKGVRQFILNSAEAVLRVPQTGRVNSLNASASAAIAMYALRP